MEQFTGDVQEVLVMACRDDDEESVRWFIVDEGVGVNEKLDYLGMTSLHTAAQEGSADVVELLIDLGADMNAPDNDGWTPLHHASQNRQVDVVRILLTRGADMNVKSSTERTSLHYAAWRGKAETVWLLLSAGARKDFKDSHGITPHMEAVRRGYPGVSRLIDYWVYPFNPQIHHIQPIDFQITVRTLLLCHVRARNQFFSHYKQAEELPPLGWLPQEILVEIFHWLSIVWNEGAFEMRHHIRMKKRVKMDE